MNTLNNHLSIMSTTLCCFFCEFGYLVQNIHMTGVIQSITDEIRVVPAHNYTIHMLRKTQ